MSDSRPRRSAALPKINLKWKVLSSFSSTQIIFGYWTGIGNQFSIQFQFRVPEMPHMLLCASCMANPSPLCVLCIVVIATVLVVSTLHIAKLCEKIRVKDGCSTVVAQALQADWIGWDGMDFWVRWSMEHLAVLIRVSSCLYPGHLSNVL